MSLVRVGGEAADAGAARDLPLLAGVGIALNAGQSYGLGNIGASTTGLAASAVAPAGAEADTRRGENASPSHDGSNTGTLAASFSP